MRRSFFDLLDDFHALDELNLGIEDQLQEAGGELTSDVEQQQELLEEFGAEIVTATVEKLDRSSFYLKHLEAEEAASKAKAEVWQAKADAETAQAKRAAKRREWLRGLMLTAVDRLVQPDAKGRVKLETGNFVLSIKPTVSASVEVAPDVDPFTLPRHLVKCEVSKSAVKAEEKAGKELPQGLSVKPNVTFSLQVK